MEHEHITGYTWLGTTLAPPALCECAGRSCKSYGGHSERETPGPIPNPEVKPFSADGTAIERSWESSAAIAKGKHPVPSRTRKLSLSAPMVLQWRRCGRVGRRRTYFEEEAPHIVWCLFCISDECPGPPHQVTPGSPSGLGRAWGARGDTRGALGGAPPPVGSLGLWC